MKFICCYLEDNYGMSVYDSEEELIENFEGMFSDEELTFEKLLIEMRGVYEVIGVDDKGNIKYYLIKE